jgi:hypothetical protein
MTTTEEPGPDWILVGTGGEIKLYLSDGTVIEAHSAELYISPSTEDK